MKARGKSRGNEKEKGMVKGKKRERNIDSVKGE